MISHQDEFATSKKSNQSLELKYTYRKFIDLSCIDESLIDLIVETSL